jgi:hypothetical protein
MSDFDLKKALRAIANRFTFERRLEQEELSKQGRARLAANSMENRIALAEAQEISVRETIHLLEGEPESDLKQQRLTTALDRLSELFAEQGRYEEAIEVTPNDARREHFQQILSAIQNIDGETCDCPPEMIVDRKKNTNFRQPAMQNLGQVVSLDHGRLVRLKVCRMCNFVNAS